MSKINVVAGLDNSGTNHTGTNTFFRRDTLAGLTKDSTTGVTFLTYLRYLKQDFLSNRQPGPYGY
jgi:hypothetical protein